VASPLTLARAAGLAALAILLAAACKSKPIEAPAKDKKVADVELSEKALEAAKLGVDRSKSQARRTSVTCAGTIDFEPARVARVGPNIAGRVGHIAVTPGQKVTRGQALVTIESVEVGRARADFLQAKSKLQQAEAELAREKKLFEGGASTERAVLNAETEKNVAGYGLRAAEERLRTLGVGGEGVASSAVPLVTPIAGTVLDVKARIGQPVGPTDTLVVVGEIDVVWLAVDIYERDVTRVHTGDEVRVVTTAYPGRVFVGKVDYVASVVDAERRVLAARIVLPNADGALRPGMAATSRIMGGAAADGGSIVTVPRGAVQTIDGQPFVFVEKAKGKYDMRAVERGEEQEGEVAIARGLAANEPVVVEGAFILKSEILREQMGSND
jgi:cobalt-zinc-cadmium efflux system membrane fusion protein